MLVVWVFAGFIGAQLLAEGLFYAFGKLGVSFAGIDQTVLMFALAACVYVLSLVVVIGVPWLVRRYRTSCGELGLTRLPSWSDILLAPAGFIVYLLATGVVMYLVMQFVPGFDAGQQQDIGFSNLVQRYELLLAFVALVVIAPIAEEMLFRGYLYGKLRREVPIWVAALVTSALFGALHGQWNVGIDVFVLSLVMCALREVTGSIWAGILLHMLKNALAFFILFIYPLLQATMGA